MTFCMGGTIACLETEGIRGRQEYDVPRGGSRQDRWVEAARENSPQLLPPGEDAPAHMRCREALSSKEVLETLVSMAVMDTAILGGNERTT